MTDKKGGQPAETGVRLQKYLSEQGIMSRRAAEKAMQSGQIRVNGRRAELGVRIDPDRDLIEVGGVPVAGSDDVQHVYLMLNKPTGVVTTLSDDLGRKCVADLIGDVPSRVWPVGRLDYESEGLLILTNDGELTNMLTHPSHEIPKIYHVTLKGSIPSEELEWLKRPMLIDGYRIRPVEVRLIADRGTSTIVEMKLREGRNRQIRKMCDACGFDVKRLRRVAIGDLELGDLPHGRWRSLSHEEIVYLKSGGTDETLRKNKASRSRGDRSGDSVRFDSPTRSHASRYTRAGQKKESGR